MSTRTLGLPEPLHTYLRSISIREHLILQEIRLEASSYPQGHMQIAPEQAQLLMLLVQLIQARRTLEIGVFMGYSALAVALALPADGQIVACEISAVYGQIAQGYWRKAGVETKIDLRIKPALETLDELLASGQDKTIDFALIDGDKRGMETYYERCLSLVRPGGLIAIDNVLWYGRVADPEQQDERTLAIRQFNHKLFQDPRVDISLLPIGDGMTLARVKP